MDGLLALPDFRSSVQPWSIASAPALAVARRLVTDHAHKMCASKRLRSRLDARCYGTRCGVDWSGEKQDELSAVGLSCYEIKEIGMDGSWKQPGQGRTELIGHCASSVSTGLHGWLHLPAVEAIGITRTTTWQLLRATGATKWPTFQD